MSVLRHGFFARGFMLCDRCVLNGSCDSFEPDGRCSIEKEAYTRVVSQLNEDYLLEGVADEILVRRAAMYLIRIARAEAYEANVGLSDKSMLWGRYVAGLDNSLRSLLRDLAVTRAKRLEKEKESLLADVDRLLHRLESKREGRKPAPRGEGILGKALLPMEAVLKDWKTEKTRLDKCKE